MFKKNETYSKIIHKAKKVIGPFILSRRSVFGWAVLCSVLAASLILSGSCVCYAVSVGGNSVGQAVTHGEFVTAVENAEKQATEILGRECTLSDAVSVSANIGIGGQSADELTQALLETVDGIEQKYAVTVDGEPVGALADEAALNAILDAILDSYSTPDTVRAYFRQDVSVEYMFVSEELVSTPAEIARLLSPDNKTSPFSLSVITEDKTETPEAIPFKTEYVCDAERYTDDRTVLNNGIDGIKSVETVTTYENGRKLSSYVSGETVLRDAISERIRVGTKSGSRTDSKGFYIMPADAPISSYYGYRSVSVGSSFHKGIDLDGDTGDNIWAADGGEVIMAERYYGYGLMVQVLHDNGDITYYAHLSEILVSVGDRVAQGDILGLMGMTGTASGDHLHFEVHPGGGEAADPMDYLGTK